MASESIKKSKLRPFLLGGVPLIALCVGGASYVHSQRYVNTDDAYISASRVAISASLSGRVVEVDVHNNQHVKKGDVLFKLDDRQYKIAVERASTQLEKAREQVDATKAEYLLKQANVRTVQETVSYQKHELARQKKLVAAGVSSSEKLDAVENALKTAQAEEAAAQQGVLTTLATLGGNASRPRDNDSSVKAAQAALNQAKLDWSYTSVTAPFDGVVTKVDNLQPGSYINASAPVFALVADQGLWVEANFKETDLARMKIGQSATIEIDALNGYPISGKVESLSPGTGSSFSLMPPENSTGNWVKVVQRLPVRIAVDPNQILPSGQSVNDRLQDGLSVQVSVNTH